MRRRPKAARRQGLLVDCLVAAAISILLLAALGSAHTGSEWYAHKWKVDKEQNYGFGGSVPGGNFRDRVEDGAQEWNALAGDMQFRRGGVDVTWSYDFSCANRETGQNSIHWGTIDGGPGQAGNFNTYARTRHCVFNSDGTRIFMIAIKFDSGDDWYNGTENPPSDKVDTKGVATHEFGHAGGFGTGANDHFPAGTDICTQPNKQTMCQGMPYGESFWRSLEEHDRHTFNNVY